MKDKKTKTYNYGNLFSIEVCQNCFSYKFNHDPSLVFHGIDVNHLDKHESPILTPKGEPDIPYYYHYLGKRYLHLGPLYMTGPEQQDNERIWFGFNVDQIKKNYQNLKYLNYYIWGDLCIHSDAHSPEEEKEMRQELFFPDYSIEPSTLICLPEELDCSLAEKVISRTPEAVQTACRFAGKDLESVILDLDFVKKIWSNYLNGLRHSSNDWEKYVTNPSYHFTECGCGIED